MKVSFAVACLLGYTAAADPVWTLESVQNHRVDAGQMAAYGEHSTNQANARPPYQSAVQIGEKNEPVWKLSSVLGHRDDQDVQNAYGDYSTEAANGRPPYKSTVQLDSESESSDSESDDETNAQIAADNKYERIITPNFSSDSDDIFMRSMIKKY